MRTCTKPTGTSSGHLREGKWFWGKTEWAKCDCGLWHSNRFIPREFWNQDWKVPLHRRIKAGIILVRGYRDIWVTQSYNRCYGFPKGEKEPYETPEGAARREFYEETGMNIDHINLSKCKTFRVYIENVEYVYFVVHVPSSFDSGTFPRDDVEITSFGWANIKTLKSLNLSRVVKILLQQKIFVG